MKASPADQARLLELQALDTRLGQLARAAKDSSERKALAIAEGDQVRVRADLATLRGSLEDAQAELRRIESDVDSVTARLSRENERMLVATDPKIATALEKEIESLRRRQSDLEDVELIVMEKVEEHQSAANQVAADLREVEERKADAEHALAAALGANAEEVAALTSRRAALVASLPADLVDLYEKQRARYGSGATLLRRGVSEASGVQLFPDELDVVRKAAPDDVLICPSSSAILVRTGESGL